MILVMNKKHGVGCTTLAYNLSRLFDIPMYVNKDNFMVDSYHKSFFPTVSKITAAKKGGIFDVGTDFKKAHCRKLIEKAKAIVIPMDFGYETIINTIDTLNFIKKIEREKLIISAQYIEPLASKKREKTIKLRKLNKDIEHQVKNNPENKEKIISSNKPIIKKIEDDYMREVESYIDEHYHSLDNLKIPIIIVLNRLDNQDSDRDFTYKEEIKNRLGDAGYFFNNSNFVLTYLRNSYGLFSNLETGEFFLDKIMSKSWKEKLQSIKNNRNWKYSHSSTIRDDFFFSSYGEFKNYYLNLEYKQFLSLANELFDRVDYSNEDIYDQDKDMVRFRTHFKENYSALLGRMSRDAHNGVYNAQDFNGQYAIVKENKLVKDIAYISYSIFKYLNIEEENSRNNNFS